MGKSTRKKLAQAAEREDSINARLQHGASGKHSRGVITSTTDGIMSEVFKILEPRYIRPITDWVYEGKSNNIHKQRLSLLRHVCGKYPVPHFLEDPMTQDNIPVVTSFTNKACDSIVPWYIAVAQGDSLYKSCSRELLSKRETHLLLQAPPTIGFKEAFWWAKAMAISNDVGVAFRIAKSTLKDRARCNSGFWVDVHRFFTVNDIPIKEIDELLDYIMAAHQESSQWTIKKRSLESIHRKSEEWHRAQYKMKQIGGGTWVGADDIPLWEHKTGKFNSNPNKNTKTDWKVEQILTGNRLVKEGQMMRHCVGSYKSACVAGRTAIFSMLSDTILTQNRRHLTIEVSVKRRIIVQARGRANRMPTPTEESIIRAWAEKNNVVNPKRWG